jgi:hypothetical protein
VALVAHQVATMVFKEATHHLAHTQPHLLAVVTVLVALNHLL